MRSGSFAKIVAVGLSVAAAVGASLSRPSPVAPRVAVVVQAASAGDAALAVRRAGGTVTHDLGLIDGVGAVVTTAQAAEALTRHLIRQLETPLETP